MLRLCASSSVVRCSNRLCCPVRVRRVKVACSASDAPETDTPVSSMPSLHLGQPGPLQAHSKHTQQQQHGSSIEGKKLPDVDWSRYHLQVLFIDQRDQLRARLAAGLFEKVAEWNGFGRALYPWSAGTDVDGSPNGRASHMWNASALISQAVMLGISPKVFTRSPEAFELRDLDSYDVVVAVDSQTREEVLSRVEPQYVPYYREKVLLLSDYAQQQPLSDSEVIRKGGLALLPRAMSQQLQHDLAKLRTVVDIQRPCLSDGSPHGVAAWNWTVLAVMLGCAGLVRYLIDAYPDDLPEYDPL